MPEGDNLHDEFSRLSNARRATFALTVALLTNAEALRVVGVVFDLGESVAKLEHMRATEAIVEVLSLSCLLTEEDELGRLRRSFTRRIKQSENLAQAVHVKKLLSLMHS